MRRFRLAAACIALCLACTTGWPQAIAGYTSHVWQALEGLPEQTVQSFAQTPDGYLWVGTTGGLVRFDGARFTLFDRQNTPALHENSIFCLMVARDGALWIGTEGGGILRYQHGQFQAWTSHDGLSNDFVRAIFQDAAGVIWAGTDNGLLQFNAGRFVRVDNTAQIPAISVHSIFQDRAGRLWAGGFKLACIDHMVARIYTLGPQLSQNMVKSVTQTQDGTLWVGTVAGLEAMPAGQDRFHPVPGISGTVRVLRQTPDGVLWIGTIGQGVFQWSGGRFTHLASPAQLPSNTVLNFFEDGEKNFWIGTQTGMLRLTHSPISIVPLPQQNDSDFGTIYQDRDASFWIGSTQLFQLKGGVIAPRSLPGMGAAHVRNVFRDRAGALWVGTDGDGLFRIAGGQTTHISALSNNFVRALAQARDGSMWIATDGGLNHIVSENGQLAIHPYLVADGLAYPSTRALLVDHSGDLWVGTDRGVSHLRGEAFLADAAIAPLAQMKVWAIHEDADGGLWFGTRDNGLYRLRNGRMAHFTVDDGLASNAIYQILEDRQSNFWMSGPNGISLLNRHDLDAQADLAVRHLALTLHSIFEMEGNTEIYGGTQPSGSITAEGDVWFPSSRGPIHILPAARTLLPPPPLDLQAALADGRPPVTTGPIVLAPGSGRLEFRFAPIRLGAQDGLRFRYQLEGFDKDWSAPTAARTADYTNLPAGNYRFRVQVFEVGNPDAVHEASIAVVQRPFFYRTWWFIATCLLGGALVAFGAYRYRMRQVHARFAAVLEERSRLAREMHDTVIQGCTGVSALLEALSMDGATDRAGIAAFAGTQLRATIDEAREAIWNLRQSHGDVTGIAEKLQSMAVHTSKEFNVPVHFTVAGTPFALSHPRAHDLLMVAREAVFNAVRHGTPQRVELTLAYDNAQLLLRVVDDGCGFDPTSEAHGKSHHFGLRGMKERVVRSGGTFALQTVPGSGVTIEVRLPQKAPHA
jgi:ligand-binding sensor domain-containing protein/signal transduction histidine kinase